MADNKLVSESTIPGAYSVRTVQIGGIDYPVVLVASWDGLEQVNVIRDTGNSTPVGAPVTVTSGSPFVGTARDLLANGGWQAVTLNVVQVTAGTAGSSFFEFGRDGTTWPVSIPTLLTGEAFVLPLPLATVYRYFRVRITAVAASFTVDVETLLHRTAPPDLTQLPSQNMGNTTPLKNVRSLLHVQKFKGGVALTGSDGFGNVPGNEAGNLISADFLTEVVKGNVIDHTLSRKVGYNADVDAAAVETIWGAGGIYTFPTAAAVVSVSSTSALDTAAGTGARNLTIEGLNASYAEITETVSLAGVVPVLTAASFLRVNRAYVATAGSDGSNAGIITATISAATQFTIPVGDNRSMFIFFTVPAGKTAYLTELTIGAINGAASALRGMLYIREGSTGLLTLRDNYACHSQGGQITVEYEAPLLIPERSDIRVDASVDANNTQVTAGYSMLLVDN